MKSIKPATKTRQPRATLPLENSCLKVLQTIQRRALRAHRTNKRNKKARYLVSLPVLHEERLLAGYIHVHSNRSVLHDIFEQRVDKFTAHSLLVRNKYYYWHITVL